MTSLRRAARGLALTLDRPGLRWALSAIFPLAGRFRPHGVTMLHYNDGWVHKFGGDYLIDLQPRVSGSELGDERIREYCGLLYIPRAGDTVVDVGAGVGSETIHYARRLGPSGRVIAIEAHPTLAALLARSVELNGFTNTTVLNLAVAEKAQQLFIDNDLAKHRGNAISGAPTEDKIEVEAKPLDQICSELSVGKIDFLKVNIEGAEQLAIQGMEEIIRRTGVVAISCHDFRFKNTGNSFFVTQEKVENWLRDHGLVIVPRSARHPWLRNQVNAYNPAVVDKSKLNPAAFGQAA